MVFVLLNEVDLPLLRVRHLPVVRQRAQLFLIDIRDLVGGLVRRFGCILCFGGSLARGCRLAAGFHGNLPGCIGALVLVFAGLCA